MPEIVEVKIMSEYINHHSKDKVFTKLFDVEKGNNAKESNIISNFSVESDSFGKELILRLYNNIDDFKFSVFMGMSGNWKYTPTLEWNNTKFTRMRLDSEDRFSLLLYGGYMGPKYRIGGFTGVKRGPDPIKQFDLFKENIFKNIESKAFDGLICDVLLNQSYFNGIGNYIRSTIMYYSDLNPFENARSLIKKNPYILDLCKDIPLKSYQLNGGQLKDWKNPFDNDSTEFKEWVFYQKGLSCKDKTNRTFWYNEKWKDYCPY